MAGQGIKAATKRFYQNRSVGDKGAIFSAAGLALGCRPSGRHYWPIYLARAKAYLARVKASASSATGADTKKITSASRESK